MSTAPKSGNPSALLSSLLSNPDLLRNVSQMLGGTNVGATEPASPPSSPPPLNSDGVAEGISRVLSNPEMMAKLPDVMKMLAPMVQGAQALPSATELPEKKEGNDRRACRNELLIALKPFLSPERCHAIDMLLGLSHLGDALQKMI